MRRVVANLPVIAGLLITVSFSVDLPFLRAVKTEHAFGLWLVVLLPLAMLSFATQFLLWWRCPWTRPWRGRAGRSG